MRQGRLSLAGLSVLFALGLALWEVYFFWFAGSFPSLNGILGLFTAERLGFNMAWLAAVYLAFQLISIPFALPSATGRFIGVKAAPHRHRAALGGRPFCSSSSRWWICSADTGSISRSAAASWTS